MTTTFTARALELITGTPPQPLDALPAVRTAFEDTLAVTYAGWHEEVTRRVASASPEGAGFRPDGPLVTEPETAAMLLGTGAHALDYDDVNLDSSGHPSAVLVAALLAAVKERPETAGRLASAFAVSLAFNTGLGQVLGFGHYEKGWHATSTVGPLAAAAGVAHLYALDAAHTRHALGIAAAQAGGLQRNFGAMAKPLQAGLAAAAGLRAVRLARAGVTADRDVFGPKGYFDLYGGEKLHTSPERVTFDLAGGGISVKLYPCCYLAHRPIAAALALREELAARGVAPADAARVEIQGPPGAFLALRITDPQRGSEGKFCGAYAVACALTDGTVGLAHFEDDAVRRPELRALLERTTLADDAPAPGGAGSLVGGAVTVTARDGAGAVLGRGEALAFPGSPESPPTRPQLDEKFADCMTHFSRHSRTPRDAGDLRGLVDGLFGGAAAAGGASHRRAG